MATAPPLTTTLSVVQPSLSPVSNVTGTFHCGGKLCAPKSACAVLYDAVGLPHDKAASLCSHHAGLTVGLGVGGGVGGRGRHVGAAVGLAVVTSAPAPLSQAWHWPLLRGTFLSPGLQLQLPGEQLPDCDVHSCQHALHLPPSASSSSVLTSVSRQ